MNWDDCLKKYAIHLEFELGLSKNSIDSYLFDIKKLKDFIEKNYNQKSPEKIKHTELKKFIFTISVNRQWHSGIHTSPKSSTPPSIIIHS